MLAMRRVWALVLFALARSTAQRPTDSNEVLRCNGGRTSSQTSGAHTSCACLSDLRRFGVDKTAVVAGRSFDYGSRVRHQLRHARRDEASRVPHCGAIVVTNDSRGAANMVLPKLVLCERLTVRHPIDPLVVLPYRGPGASLFVRDLQRYRSLRPLVVARPPGPLQREREQHPFGLNPTRAGALARHRVHGAVEHATGGCTRATA